MKNTLAAISILIASASTAFSASLEINGGLLGSIPGSSQATTPNNDVLDYFTGKTGSRVAGYYGSELRLTEPANLRVELLGAEAAMINSFVWNDTDVLFAGQNDSATGSDVIFSAKALEVFLNESLLPFSFVNGNGDSVANSIADNTLDGVNFFATFAENGRGRDRTGDSVVLFFDDTGQYPNADYDDLVVRISVDDGLTSVPLPAGALLLLSALGILAMRRKT